MTPTRTAFLPSFHLRLAFWTLLFFAMTLGRAHAAQVILSWTANSEIDLAGYKIYSGTKSHIYDRPVVLASAKQTSISLAMPEDGRIYFFAVTAYDVVNQESVRSTEVSWTSPLPNKPPVANASSLLVTEDVAVAGTLLASDSDGNSLTYKLVSNGGKGTVILTNAATGAYSYAPRANVNGTDSFTFKVNDGKLDSNVATVSVSITAVNDAPVASSGSLSAQEDTTATGTMSASDPDGNSLTYKLVSNGSKGTVTLTNVATGAFTYKPKANGNGTDSFTFKVNDGKVDSNVATVTVTITSVNDAPVASNGSLAVLENISATGMLGASDMDGNSLTYKLVSNGSKGTVTLTNVATGAYSYAPKANTTGTDSFTFKVNDGKVDSNVATVSISIAQASSLLAKIKKWLGAYWCSTAEDGLSCLAGLNNAFWRNYRLSVTVASLDDDVVDILFRYQDSNNYYRFTWDTQLSQRQLLKCEDGEATVLAEDNGTGVFNKAYQLEVVADESTIEIRVDDALILAVSDTRFEEGGVALFSQNHLGDGFFKDIQVEDLATGRMLVPLLP